KDSEQQALAIKSAFVAQLDSLESLSRDEIANDRFEKFRNIGSYIE
ncbi:acetyl-CoA carboxylase carboxyl transferase subunit alpha, partial [Escherichia coli]|nr:acetyl-CoA carboxylase carboxyl transferase subunit alpha [Escherichia coli]